MCGICGKLSFSGGAVSPDILGRMNQALRHRGPDEDGFYSAHGGGFGMAMRRLKVIDLSTGNQPLFNETRDVAVMLNGEIYNYIELRETLKKHGHRFATQSDTEAIVHGYEVYGTEVFKHLNGMFAVALWDDKNKTLVLARDRMGVKPLYYRADEAGISFASEIKALLQDPDCKKELDPAALDDYFSLLYVPGPRSIFKSIQKLEPGHMLVCGMDSKKISKQAYWESPYVQDPQDRGWDFYEKSLDELMRDSLNLELRSDVPNGVFLSSGLDSGAIAYYASQVSERKVKTFTVDFRGGGAAASYSESQGAREIARVCGTDHEEIVLEPKAEEIILQTADFFDEPFADTSAIPTFLLCRAAKRKITVALSGEGGDELFGGYPTYLATLWAGRYRNIPAFVRGWISSLVAGLPVSWERISWDYKLKQFVYGAQFEPQRAHYAWKEIFTEGDKKKLYTSEFQDRRAGHDGFESFQKIFSKLGKGAELEKLLAVDQNTYLLDQFLVKSDRMSMAHALEVRVPMLDHRIVEFAARIPAKYKARGFETKIALRRLMKGKLPDSIVRGEKKGFSPPIAAWIAGELKDFVLGALSPERVRKTGVLDPDAVRDLLDEHFARKRDNHRRIWCVLNFVLWHERWA
ncbi:MAG: asparagine synthase (glutamine-hydrolyzing) [Elusimicrobia bacterium RIFCSPLOWO2_01_FULL_60_11]|nr:MAG: asparagine synthase (glutamine-hydrolyzing) [Elusimicrobia bacterium RIFCSPLOWO2_01_FULL_60_11]